MIGYRMFNPSLPMPASARVRLRFGRNCMRSCPSFLDRYSCALAALLAAVALAGCGLDREAPSPEPTFYRDLAQPGAELDAAAAQSMISGYRQNNSLGPVTLDPALMKLADEQARAMAQHDKIDRNIIRP